MTCSKLTTETLETGFLTGFENVERVSLQNLMVGGLNQYMGKHGILKMLSKNICEKLFIVLFLGIMSWKGASLFRGWVVFQVGELHF